MGATRGSRRERLNEVAKKTKKCPRCPPHDVENRGRRARDDKHKGKRR